LLKAIIAPAGGDELGKQRVISQLNFTRQQNVEIFKRNRAVVM